MDFDVLKVILKVMSGIFVGGVCIVFSILVLIEGKNDDLDVWVFFEVFYVVWVKEIDFFGG